MITQLRYFNGKEIIKLTAGQGGIEELNVTKDNKAIITMSNGIQRTVISSYIEFGSQMTDIDEALDTLDSINF